MSPEEILSDEAIVRVHGFANFGDMAPREVVAEGVIKYAFGYSTGHTQMTILREHGLIRSSRKPGVYRADLTEKGKRYLRAMFSGRFATIAEIRAALAHPAPERPGMESETMETPDV